MHRIIEMASLTIHIFFMAAKKLHCGATKISPVKFRTLPESAQTSIQNLKKAQQI